MSRVLFVYHRLSTLWLHVPGPVLGPPTQHLVAPCPGSCLGTTDSAPCGSMSRVLFGDHLLSTLWLHVPGPVCSEVSVATKPPLLDLVRRPLAYHNNTIINNINKQIYICVYIFILLLGATKIESPDWFREEMPRLVQGRDALIGSGKRCPDWFREEMP